eukprot:Rmarinus@m.16708
MTVAAIISIGLLNNFLGVMICFAAVGSRNWWTQTAEDDIEVGLFRYCVKDECEAHKGPSDDLIIAQATGAMTFFSAPFFFRFFCCCDDEEESTDCVDICCIRHNCFHYIDYMSGKSCRNQVQLFEPRLLLLFLRSSHLLYHIINIVFNPFVEKPFFNTAYASLSRAGFRDARSLRKDPTSRPCCCRPQPDEVL